MDPDPDSDPKLPDKSNPEIIFSDPTHRVGVTCVRNLVYINKKPCPWPGTRESIVAIQKKQCCSSGIRKFSHSQKTFFAENGRI